MEASTARRLRFSEASEVGRAVGATTVQRPVTPMMALRRPCSEVKKEERVGCYRVEGGVTADERSGAGGRRRPTLESSMIHQLLEFLRDGGDAVSGTSQLEIEATRIEKDSQFVMN
jgi:hypothetical protein